MEIVKHYICDICGADYADEDVCRKCERTHKKIKNVKACYVSFAENKNGYPLKIDVEFENGEILTYS